MEQCEVYDQQVQTDFHKSTNLRLGEDFFFLYEVESTIDLLER